MDFGPTPLRAREGKHRSHLIGPFLHANETKALAEIISIRTARFEIKATAVVTNAKRVSPRVGGNFDIYHGWRAILHRVHDRFPADVEQIVLDNSGHAFEAAGRPNVR